MGDALLQRIDGQHRLQILVEIAQHRPQLVLECPDLVFGEIFTLHRANECRWAHMLGAHCRHRLEHRL